MGAGHEKFVDPDNFTTFTHFMQKPSYQVLKVVLSLGSLALDSDNFFKGFADGRTGEYRPKPPYHTLIPSTRFSCL